MLGGVAGILTKDGPLNGEFGGGVLRVDLHVKLRFQISELLPSLKLTANAPENRQNSQMQKRPRLPTIHFPVRTCC